MRLGISSFALSWAVGIPGYPPERPLAAAEILDRAAQLEVGVVQFGDNLPLHELPEDELHDLDTHARDLGIELELGVSGHGPDLLRAYLRLCRVFDARVLRVMPGWPELFPDRGDAVESVREVADEFAEAGVAIGLENFEAYGVADLARAVRTVDHPAAGACLDTINSIGAVESPEYVIETLAPLAVNVHLKDYAIRRFDHRLGLVVEGRPCGQGRLDIGGLLRALEATDRDPNVILELWTPPEQDIEDTVAKESEWLEESVAHMHPLLPE
ncbi:MAG: sugar phosphate isomerase/epimerase family protein [Planctomycetota bacterium]